MNGWIRAKALDGKLRNNISIYYFIYMIYFFVSNSESYPYCSLPLFETIFQNNINSNENTFTSLSQYLVKTTHVLI